MEWIELRVEIMVLQYKSDELNSKMKKTIRHTENLCDRYLNGKLNSSCRN